MDNNTYLPSTQDLADIYGAGNPMTYRAAEQNLGTLAQFQQQALQQQRQATQKGFLQNQFDEQNNPQRIEEQRLSNVGKDTTNQSAGLTLDRQKANQQAAIDEDKRKAILGASQFEIDQFAKQVDKMMISADPNIRKQGQQLREYMPTIQDMRQKHKDEMEKVNTQRASAERIASGNNLTSLEIARLNQKGQNDRALNKTRGGGTDFWSTFYTKLKNSKDRHAALMAEAEKVKDEQPEEAQRMLSMANVIRAQAEAEIASAKPGSADLNALGVTAVPGPNIGGPKQAPALPPGWKEVK